MLKGEESKEWAWETDALPCGGTLSISIYPGQPFSSTYAGLSLNSIELTMYQSGFIYPEKYEFDQNVNPDSWETIEYTTEVGDAPAVNVNDVTSQIDNGYTLYKGLLLRYSGGEYHTTGSWDYKDGNDPQFLIRKLVHEIGEFRSRQQLIIETSVYSKSLCPISVLKEMTIGILHLKRFRVTIGTYNGLTGEWSITLVQTPVYEILAAKDGRIIKTKSGKSIVIR